MTFPILLAVVVLLVSSSSALFSLPLSPCPEIYEYEFGEKWSGLISVLTPPRYAQAELEATFSSRVAITPKDQFKMSVRGGDKGILEAKKMAQKGRRHALRFTIQFPQKKTVPTLLKVTVNGRLICSGDEVPDNSHSETTLNAIVTTGLETPVSDGQDFGIVSTKPGQRDPYTEACWPEYESLAGIGCYKEVKENMTWKAAQKNCEQLGAELAVPRTQQEIDFFNVIAGRPNGQSPWLGIFKSDGEWRTLEGTVILENSSLWDPGEPSGNGKCGAVWEIGGLDDRGCEAMVRSICQQP